MLIMSCSASLVWSSDIAVTESARFEGQYGLQITLSEGQAACLTDESPDQETRVRVRFYLKLDLLQLESGDILDLWVGRDAADFPHLILGVERASQVLGLVAWVVQDDGGYLEFPLNSGQELSSGWCHVEMDWRSGDGDGRLQCWLDGDLVLDEGELTNGLSTVDRVDWGVTSELSPASEGDLFLDAYEIRRAGEIGPICFDIAERRRSMAAWPQSNDVLRLVEESNHACPDRLPVEGMP